MLQDKLCYIRYEGALVERGLLDVRKAGESLLSFDAALRRFLAHEIPELVTHDFEIPICIQPGSWEAWIPETIGELVAGLLATGSLALVTTAAIEIAKTEFEGETIRAAFVRAMRSIQWVVRIAQHLGTATQRKFDNLRWRENNLVVGIPNKEDDYIFVPREHLDAYTSCSKKVLTGMVEPVQEGRNLILGVVEDGRTDDVFVGTDQRSIFVEDEEEDVLPELKHGAHVELMGYVTRGNEITNSVGFRIKGHILDCHPTSGSVTIYREEMYSRCMIRGVVSREIAAGRPVARRPKIYFSELVPYPQALEQLGLFETR